MKVTAQVYMVRGVLMRLNSKAKHLFCFDAILMLLFEIPLRKR